MKHKRLLSMLLALIMVLSLLPVSALAAPAEEPVEGQVTAVKSLATDDNGEPVVDTDGNYTVQISIQGNPVTQTTGSAADVVLVVDNSGSMDSSVGIKCTNAASTFEKINSRDFLIAWTWNTYACPNCGAKYFDIVGDISGERWYTDMPDICTGEVGEIVRINAAKEVSKEFAEAILADGTNNQLAVIGFAHEEKEGGANDTGAIKVAQPLTKDLTSVNTAIETMQAKGGTNSSAALQQAYNYLDARADKSRPAYVVFISDGAPGYSGESLNDTQWNGAEQITALKNAGVTVYTVGIALDTDPANYLKNMASDVKDEHFINVTGTDYKDQLAEILAKWAIQINKAPAGTDAKIVDVINTEDVTFVGSQSENLVYNAENNTRTGNIGNIPAEEAVATFKVKPVDG
ncbi:MAG: vWA domain-containing protein, partial [Oscillospiraceae bacterium]|nr:vWA domain-containing protein [Oscillospiraceae bacterium]